MSVRWEPNFGRVERAIKNSLGPVTTMIAKDANTYVKKDTGATEASMWSASDFSHGFIIWDTAYAGYAYYLEPALRGKNPNAQVRWFDFAKARHMSEWVEKAQKIVESGL